MSTKPGDDAMQRLPDVGDEDAPGVKCFFQMGEWDGELVLVLGGVLVEFEDDGEVVITSTPGAIAMGVDGAHLQALVDHIRAGAGDRGITIV